MPSGLISAASKPKCAASRAEDQGDYLAISSASGNPAWRASSTSRLQLRDRVTFSPSGPKERGLDGAPRGHGAGGGGVIHTDFEKGFSAPRPSPNDD